MVDTQCTTSVDVAGAAVTLLRYNHSYLVDARNSQGDTFAGAVLARLFKLGRYDAEKAVQEAVRILAEPRR